jgi:nicotinamidase-related amidase/type 1 glutamine amidotransferase
LRKQIPVEAGSGRFHRVIESESWSSEKVAVIICDVWDSHHCLNAVRRVTEVAPRIDAFAEQMRSMGATIVHAPSECMEAYADHPARHRARSVPQLAHAPVTIRDWCNSIESETGFPYPVDQSDGGEDDDLLEHEQWHAMLAAMGRKPKTPWLMQTPAIGIDSDRDYISDSGTEIWHILKHHGIEHVLVCGVHTNMCVLGRPFGLRQLREHGFHVVLVRDLTDTMYNPQRWPYVNHFTGTDLVVDHVERAVCQTMTSDQILGGKPFRFSKDRRPHWIIMISEDEYHTEKTLVEWARIHLAKSCEVSFVFEDLSQPGTFPGIEALEQADALLVSVRRRPLRADALHRIKAFVERGGPILGIRTASHAFSLRENAPSPGLMQWPEFDADVLGGNYVGHHGNDEITLVTRSEDPMPSGFESLVPESQNLLGEMYRSRGSLYRVQPLRPGTRVVWQGTIPNQPGQPVAWTFVRSDSGKTFYTSLGHESDFEQPMFRALLLQAAHWLTDTHLEVQWTTIDADRQAYLSGQGKQK